jgi:hypothetical protein
LLRSGFGYDNDLDLAGHAGAEFDPDGKFAERLDRLIQQDALFVDLDPLGQVASRAGSEKKEKER